MSRKNVRSGAVVTAALAALICAGGASAQWQITTYKSVVHPEIATMALADEYYLGVRPSRFVGNGTVTEVDLAEGTGGQFTFDNPFPGLDNLPTVGDTNDYTARVSGTLVVNTAGQYDFFTDSDDGNRFRLDLNQNGTFEDATESIVPDGGLQGAGTPERSGLLTLAAGNYKFEVSFFERAGGASVDAGYRVNGAGTQFVLGDATGGIGLAGPADVRVVGANVSGQIVNFAQADALRSGENAVGFPATESRPVFNIVDSGGDADFLGGTGAPGLGAPDADDDDDFLVVGVGKLVIPAGGLTNVVFRSNTDDGGRLLIDLNQDGDVTDPGDVVILQDALQGPTNTDSAPMDLAAGEYLIEYSFFERGGGAQGEVSADIGNGFRLLGDTANGGLPVVAVPEPSSLAVLGLGALSLVVRRRRR